MKLKEELSSINTPTNLKVHHKKFFCTMIKDEVTSNKIYTLNAFRMKNLDNSPKKKNHQII